MPTAFTVTVQQLLVLVVVSNVVYSAIKNSGSFRSKLPRLTIAGCKQTVGLLQLGRHQYPGLSSRKSET